MNIENRLTRQAEKIRFSGNLSIYRQGQNIYGQSFGYRDQANKILNDADTRFGMASGTKLFTALGILKLIADGVLKLSTTVFDIFGRDLGFVHPEASIGSLLSHRSGIYDYYDEEVITDFDNFTVEIPWCQLATPSDYLPLFQSRPMKFNPLERVSYSNGGYVFLGIIIEKLTGQLYRSYITDKVFKLANMAFSGFFAFNELPANTANGYISTNAGSKTNIYQLPIRGGGDGGAYTNSADMLKLWTQLFAFEVIPEEILSRLLHKEVEIWPGQDYGLGLYLSRFANFDSCYTSGCDAGVGCISLYVPEIELNINVFSNLTDGAELMMDFIIKNSQDLVAV